MVDKRRVCIIVFMLVCLGFIYELCVKALAKAPGAWYTDATGQAVLKIPPLAKGWNPRYGKRMGFGRRAGR